MNKLFLSFVIKMNLDNYSELKALHDFYLWMLLSFDGFIFTLNLSLATFFGIVGYLVIENLELTFGKKFGGNLLLKITLSACFIYIVLIFSVGAISLIKSR